MAEQIQETNQENQGVAANAEGSATEAGPENKGGAQNGGTVTESTNGLPLGEIPAYLKELPVKVDVLLGSVKLTVRELLNCGPGSVIDIGKKASEPFDLLVNGRLVAKGEVVVMHDRLGLKVVEVISTPTLPS